MFGGQIPSGRRIEEGRYVRLSEKSGIQLLIEMTPRSRDGDYDVLKRCRLIRSFLILDSSVCLGTPSLVAAPVGPEIWPSASRSAFSIIARSRSARSETKGTVCVVGLDDLGLVGAGASQLGSTQNISPSQSTTARSITFCNSRMLPGQSYPWNKSSVFLLTLRIRLPAF